MSYARLISGTDYMRPRPEPAPPGTLALHFGTQNLSSAEACYAIMDDKGLVSGEYKVLAGGGCWGRWLIKKRGQRAFKRVVLQRTLTDGGGKPEPARQEIVDQDRYTAHLEAEIDRMLGMQ